MQHAPFTQTDHTWMTLALTEAQAALASGDYPVGAVLTVDGALVGQARNAILSEAQSTAHAEQNLMRTHSPYLRRLARDDHAHHICLYTTLEPCLMCLGVAVLHRVNRIVIGCPDPHGGASGVNPRDLGRFYIDHWPQIDRGLLRAQSADMIIEFLKTETFLSWEIMLAEFTAMRAGW